MTKEEKELATLNPWKEVAAKMQKCIDTKIWTCDDGFVCSEDIDIVKAHNEKCKQDCLYQTKIPPYPYSGNILTAKVVILLLNPGYDEKINYAGFHKELDDNQKQDFYQSVINDLNFSAERSIEHNVEENMSNQYWNDRFSKLSSDDGIDKDIVLKEFALLQSVGYHSTHNVEYRSLGRLPSTKYVYKIIDYLVNQTECLFVIARRNYFWEDLLDIKEVSSKRIIKLNSTRSTSISSGNMSKDDFDKIINILKD